MQVLIYDAQTMAESLALAIEAQDSECHAEVVTTLAQVEHQLEVNPPDLMIVEIEVEDSTEKLGLLDSPAVRSGATRVIFLSRHDHRAMRDAAQRRGAAGYLVTSSSLQLLIAAIHVIHGGGSVFEGPFTTAAGVPMPTDRELELLRSLARGLTNVAVAHELNISSRTVDSHLRRLFTRYGVSSRSQLLMLAIREGWISPHQEGH